VRLAPALHTIPIRPSIAQCKNSGHQRHYLNSLQCGVGSRMRAWVMRPPMIPRSGKTNGRATAAFAVRPASCPVSGSPHLEMPHGRPALQGGAGIWREAWGQTSSVSKEVGARHGRHRVAIVNAARASHRLSVETTRFVTAESAAGLRDNISAVYLRWLRLPMETPCSRNNPPSGLDGQGIHHPAF